MSFNLKEQRMDLLKPKGTQTLQITFDENINVPDIKPDIDKILQTKADVFVTKEEIQDNKVHLLGELRATILYVPLNDKKPIHSMDLIIPFEENIHSESINPKDYLKMEYTIEDLVPNLLNSRKVSLKSLVQLKLDIQEKKEVYLTSEIESTNEIEKQISKVTFCQLKDSSNTHYKIKDEVGLPSGKPNITEILWYDTTLQNKEIKLIDGKVNIKGTLHLAAIYSAESSENSIEFIENDITFNGLLDCPGCRENMFPDVQIKILNGNVQIRPDVDGEERVLSVEVDTKVDIKVYDEQETGVLSDLYALDQDLIVKKDPVHYQKLLCKNQSQYNLKEPILIDNENNEIMQVYYTSGDCTIERADIQKDKINVEGTLFCKIMYVAADDRMPIHVYESALPFDHQIDIKGLKETSQVSITPNINYIGCTMISGQEIDLKCAIQMNTIVFDDCTIDIITNVEDKPLDIKNLQKIPGIVGYIVKEKDTLWDIAKKYRTRIKSIKSTNGLEDDKITKGDQLIIVKEIQF